MVRRARAQGSATGFDGEPGDGPRRWLKVAGIAVTIVLLLVVVVMLISDGEHGPGRHASMVGDRRHTHPSASVTAI